MKYTIEGFSQQVMYDLGFDCTDAVILRFIIDFYNTNKMTKITHEGKEYFWLSYQYVIDNIPLIRIKSKIALARRFLKYEQSGIMERYTHKVSGTFSCFRFTEKYEKLVGSTEEIDHSTEKSKGLTEKLEGLTEKLEGVKLESKNPINSKVKTKDHSIKKDYSIKEYNKYIRFKKPSIEEIKQYCQERKNNIDSNAFFDFYESKNWMVGKNKMSNWKAAIRTWERNNTYKQSTINPAAGRSDGKPYPIDYEY